MTLDPTERLEQRIKVLEEGHRTVVQTLATMQADAAQSRGEQRQLLEEVRGEMKTLIRQADIRRGAEEERDRASAVREKQQARFERWILFLLPFLLGALALAALEYLDISGFDRDPAHQEG